MHEQRSGGALSSLGWGDRVAALFNEIDDPDAVPGRVVRVDGQKSIVAMPDGTEAALSGQELPSVGDWVAVRNGAIRRVLERWSTLTRMDPNGFGVQTLASNVDLVLVAAPADRLNAGRVERELVVGWESGARPVVVVTKADTCLSNAIEDLERRLVGVDVVASSVVTGEGVDAVASVLRPDRTAVLLGPSGAGKSSLANAILGVDLLATGDVRDRDHRGRHTTTSRQLVAVPGGGVLIDTPGIRSLGLPGAGDLDSAFPDIDELSAMCRFNDCRHGSEPGCAVTAAIHAGSLDPDRLKSFRKLERELRSGWKQVDPAKRRAAKKRFKELKNSMRDYDRRRLR